MREYAGHRQQLMRAIAGLDDRRDHAEIESLRSCRDRFDKIVPRWCRGVWRARAVYDLSVNWLLLQLGLRCSASAVRRAAAACGCGV